MTDLNLVVDCPECGGGPVSVWCACPECGWYDEAQWERALVDELPPDAQALVERLVDESPTREPGRAQKPTHGGR
jgi:hypothetical protein